MARALLPPSGAHRWMRCPGSVVLEAEHQDKTTQYAEEGTAAHELAAIILTAGGEASSYIGHVLNGFEVDDDMAGYVQRYVDYIKSIGGQLLVEYRLPIEHITGEPGAVGTADAVILCDDEIIIADLKYGKGVKVEAQDNPQLLLYAAAAVDEFGFYSDFKRTRIAIVQPRIDAIEEAVYTLDELASFRTKVKRAADMCFDAMTMTRGALVEYLNPGVEQCKFCKAKATCPALTDFVLSQVADDFVDVTKPVALQIAHAAEREVDNTILANLLGAVDLIEDWCRAIRERAESELLAGRPVPGYKLVAGRKGQRKWSDEQAVEEMLKDCLREDELYERKLISPTTTEKLCKRGAIESSVWEALQAYIKQAEGEPIVVPESDKRPAIDAARVLEEFDDLTMAEK